MSTTKWVMVTVFLIVIVLLAKQNQKSINDAADADLKRMLQQIEEQDKRQQQKGKVPDPEYKRTMLLYDMGSSLSSIKSSVAAYKRRHGEYPADMTVLGLNSEKNAGRYAQSVRIDKGEIYAFLKPAYGNNKIIRVFHTGSFPDKWSCTTTLELDGRSALGGMPCSEVPNISFSGSYFQ